MTESTIGAVSKSTGISIDTLRYYDRIGLVSPANRGANGRRYYAEDDFERLRFVRRAQASGFSLEDIAELMQFRQNPGDNRGQVRAMAAARLDEIEARLADLTQLRNELRLLLSLCAQAQDGCPIIEHWGRVGG